MKNYFIEIYVLQQQVPLPLPCVNLTQIATSALIHKFVYLGKNFTNLTPVGRFRSQSKTSVRDYKCICQISKQCNSSSMMGGVCKV